METEDTITVLLKRVQEGDSGAESRLVERVYPELRMMAARYMQRERGGHTLQTTALVNEAYMRLANARETDWKDRAHFFAVAARIMRRVLVDHARLKLTGKRGAGAVALPLDEALVFSEEKSSSLVRLDDALERLGQIDERAAKIIELRFFGGLSIEETAEALHTSPRTVKREWAFGRSWLRAELEPDGPRGS